MKKTTHWLITKTISDDYNLSGVERFILCIGSILPDLSPSLIYNQHTFRNRYSEFKLREEQLKELKGLRFYLECGRLLHYVGDFFTRPHNRCTFLGSLVGHKSWERALARKFKSEFRGSSPVKCDLYLDHINYLREKRNIEVDYEYIVNEVTYFLYSLMKGRLVEYA